MTFNIIKKTALSDIFFYISYFLYVSIKLIYTSMIYVLFPEQVAIACKYLCAICALLSILFNPRWTKRSFLRAAVFLVVGFIVFRRIHNIDFFCIVLIMISSYKKNIKFVFTLCLAINLVYVFIVPMLSTKGLISDNTYSHFSTLDLTTDLVHSRGFIHYSNGAFIILYISIIYLYLKDFSTNSILLTSMLNVIAFKVFTAKLPIVVYAFVVALFLFLKITRIIDKKNKVIAVIFASCAVFIFLLSFISIKLYANGNGFMEKVNFLTQNRISLAQKGIKQYGISLFGQKIEMRGSFYFLDSTHVNEEYFFIDNDYVLMLIEYGIIFSLFVLLIYLVMIYKFTNDCNKALTVISLAPTVFGLVNTSFLVIEYNPIIFIGINILLDYKMAYKNTNFMRIYQNNFRKGEIKHKL